MEAYPTVRYDPTPDEYQQLILLHNAQYKVSPKRPPELLSNGLYRYQLKMENAPPAPKGSLRRVAIYDEPGMPRLKGMVTVLYPLTGGGVLYTYDQARNVLIRGEDAPAAGSSAAAAATAPIDLTADSETIGECVPVQLPSCIDPAKWAVLHAAHQRLLGADDAPYPSDDLDAVEAEVQACDAKDAQDYAAQAGVPPRVVGALLQLHDALARPKRKAIGTGAGSAAPAEDHKGADEDDGENAAWLAATRTPPLPGTVDGDGDGDADAERGRNVAARFADAETRKFESQVAELATAMAVDSGTGDHDVDDDEADADAVARREPRPFEHTSVILMNMDQADVDEIITKLAHKDMDLGAYSEAGRGAARAELRQQFVEYYRWADDDAMGSLAAVWPEGFPEDIENAVGFLLMQAGDNPDDDRTASNEVEYVRAGAFLWWFRAARRKSS